MQSKILLLLSVLLFTACSKTPVAELTESEKPKGDESRVVEANPETGTDSDSTDNSETALTKETEETNGDPATEPQPVSTNSKSPNSAETAAAAKLAERVKAAQTELDSLDEGFNAAATAWQVKFRAAKTAEERDAVRKEGPGETFAKKYLELSDKFSGTPVALASLEKVLKRGSDETKQIASSRLLGLANADTGTLESEAILLNVAAMGDDESKLSASQALADLVSQDPDSDVARRLAPQVLDLRDMSPGKKQVAQLLIDIADQDVRSKKALERLVTVASKTSGDTKSSALSRITEHHLESDNILDVIKDVTSGQSPDQASEVWLKEVCRKAPSATVKGSAAIALKDIIDRRDMYRNFYSGADEETRSELDKETLAYLDAEPDPNELGLIETTLDGYVTDNESLLESAKEKLFIVKHLSVGKTAPDITGVDLDGVNFALSEYRGKVVFLDFWGDW